MVKAHVFDWGFHQGYEKWIYHGEAEADVANVMDANDDDVDEMIPMVEDFLLPTTEEVENNPRYVFEKVDICDLKSIESIFEKYQPDAVMHLAAESHVDRSITGSADFIQTNIVGTYTLLEVAKNYWHTLDEAKKSTFRFQRSKLF